MAASLQHPAPPPLPATLQDWDASLKIKPKQTINDMVHDMHRRLLADPERGPRYARYLDAIYDEQAVEKAMDIDDAKAAEMIREKASEDGQYHDLAAESLSAIRKALRVVLRRFGQSRQERAQTVAGVRVPDENPPPREERNYGGDGE